MVCSQSENAQRHKQTHRRAHLHCTSTGAFPVRENGEFKGREGVGDAGGHDVYAVAASALPSNPATGIGVRGFQVGQLSRDPGGSKVKTQKDSQTDGAPGGHRGEIHGVTGRIHAAATVSDAKASSTTHSSRTCWPTAGPHSPHSQGDCRL